MKHLFSGGVVASGCPAKNNQNKGNLKITFERIESEQLMLQWERTVCNIQSDQNISIGLNQPMFNK